MKKTLLASLALISTLSLAGCITINQAADHSNHMTDGHGEVGELSANDLMFLQMMIPHHQQAVEMAALAEQKSSNEELLALASQIDSAQHHEIEHMSSWLEDAGVSEMMDHSHGDMGMLSEEQMTALAAAEGVEFDRLFLEGMIQHHEGAIDMAQMILESENAEVKSLGESIVETQTKDIEQMKGMLSQLQG